MLVGSLRRLPGGDGDHDGMELDFRGKIFIIVINAIGAQN